MFMQTFRSESSKCVCKESKGCTFMGLTNMGQLRAGAALWEQSHIPSALAAGRGSTGVMLCCSA